MIKLSLVLIIHVIFIPLWADFSNLVFSSELSTYQAISGGTVLGDQFNDNECFINSTAGTPAISTGTGFPIGFPFSYNGETYTNFAVQTNGWIVLGNGTFTIGGPNTNAYPLSIPDSFGYYRVISALGMELRAGQTSSLTFKTIGTSPFRILVVQWSNYVNIDDPEKFNFQIRLHETSNIIEFAYGEFVVMTNNSNYAEVGLRGTTNTDYLNRSTMTSWLNTQAGTNNSSNCRISYTVYPVNGLSFRFCPYDPDSVPLPAQCVSPSFHAAHVATNASLVWNSGSENTEGYYLSFGTDNPPTNIYDHEDLGLVTSFAIPETLEDGCEYFWKIIPYNTAGETQLVNVWQFNTGIYFPVNEGFETNVIPPGWSHDGNQNIISRVNSGLLPTCSPHRGNYMLKLNSHDLDSFYNVSLTSMPYELNQGLYEVGLWVYRDNGHTNTFDRVELYQNTSPTSTGAQFLGRIFRSNILPPAENSSNAWHCYSFNILNESTSSTRYFILKFYCDHGNNLYVDDFFLKKVDDQPYLISSESSLDFGRVPINNGSPFQSIMLTNNSPSPILSMQVACDQPDFTISYYPYYTNFLSPGDQVGLNIVFHPTEIGNKTGTITLTSPDLVNSLQFNVSGTGISDVINPPFQESFENGFPLFFWKQGYANFAENTTIQLDTDSVFWTLGNYQSEEQSNNLCLKSTIIENTSRNWLVTPPILMDPLCKYTLKFDLSVTMSETSIPISFSEDDKLDILVNPLSWQTWSQNDIIREITSLDTTVFQSKHVSVDLDDFIQYESIRLAFYLESTENNGNLDVFIDNFAITYHLFEPQNLTGHWQNYNDVTLDWTSPAETRNIREQGDSYKIKEISNNEQNRNLLGYKVYRNLAWIATLNQTDQLTYTDQVEAGQNYEYTVTAVYSNGESRPSNRVMIYVPEPNYEVLLNQDFECYSSFSANLPDWRSLDLDGSATYSLPNTIFPGSGAPHAFIVFSPRMTHPALTGVFPMSGNKMLACFASVSGVNNDWLITPCINFGFDTIFRFWARSYSNEYCAEKIQVLLNTQDADPAHFVSISNNAYFQIPAYWNEYVFDLSEYEGQTGYLAIQCISENGLALFLDDLKLISAGGLSGNDPAEVGLTNLSQNYPNPFNPSTTINFSLEQSGNAELNIYNIKGEKIKTLLDKSMPQGNHSVKWDGKNSAGKSVSSGIYYYKLKTETKTFVRKMILLK